MSALSNRAAFITLIVAALAALISAECPNACSSHGKCGAFDACQCYRNWMSNDCSERICQFGLAHVDSPKGDLDSSSGKLYSPEATSTNAITPNSRIAKPIIVGDAMYPKGTYEQYPNVVNTRNEIISDSAHDYMECSNKGLCDRSSGVCNCFDGYDGSACQRASCPTSSAGFCSGHGMCYTAKEIARGDYNNSYNLWDEYSTMGCICDPGYSGADCSEQMCKFGADPLFYDDERNIRYANFTFALYTIDQYDGVNDIVATPTASPTGSIRSDQWEGNFSIVFYDIYGKPWWSPPINVLGNCDDITNSLEALPNNVIPSGSVRCSMDFATEGAYIHESKRSSASAAVGKPVVGAADGYPIALDSSYYSSGAEPVVDTSGYFPFTGVKFTLAFPSNPGKLRQPYIDLNLDGTRPTVFAKFVKSTNADANVIRKWVFPNGYSGENFDFVPDLCQGVKLTLKSGASAGSGTVPSGWGSFDGLTTDEVILLKKCLGDADGDLTNNNKFKLSGTQDALYNWDYGFEDESLASSGSFAYAADKLKNPHLVKLVDTSTSSETRLCDGTTHTFTGVNQINQVGFCNNPDAPGFYVVVYYNPSASVFSFLSNAYDDFSTSTEFLVFTTTGYLTLSSSTTDIFTVFLDAALAAPISVATAKIDLGSMYSNVVYSYYSTLPAASSLTTSGQVPNVDCESARSLVAACIEKGDYVMIFQTSAATVSVSANPRYMNMYQVMKISRQNREAVRAVSYTTNTLINQEVLRYQIVLDMGLNARYSRIAAASTPSHVARIYKFTPPAVSVDYVDQCSMRGICDTTNGLCKCFSGYTGDNCAVMNALAV